MYHYIYKTTSKSGLYYYGRHSTENINDGYVGSGTWVRSIKDKSTLSKDIVEMCSSVSELKDRERYYISAHIGNPSCMNYNENSCGFSSINNPAKSTPKSILSERVSGSKNGMYGKTHSAEYKKHLSETMSGEGNPFYGKRHTEETKKRISDYRMGTTASEATRAKLSESRRGSKHPQAKLTEEEVTAIYKLAWKGDMKQREIGALYNIRQGVVAKIKQGIIWSSLTSGIVL